MDGRRQPADPVDIARPVSRRVVVMAMGVDDLAAIARVLADHFDSAAAFWR
jgi:siroheme synthase